MWLFTRLCRPDRRAHRTELLGLAARVLKLRPRVGIDEVPLLDVGVAQPNQQARVLSLQERSGNSASPEVDALGASSETSVWMTTSASWSRPPGLTTRSISAKTASLSGTRSMT